MLSFPEKISCPCNTLVRMPCGDQAHGVGIPVHRPELIDDEITIVFAYSGLPVKDAAPGVDHDPQSDNNEQGQKQEDGQEG